MTRAKRGFKARRRRNKVLKQAKGYRGGSSKLFRSAVERVNKANQYAYRDRKVKKRDFRSLWIVRINAATKALGLSYSKFMHGLKEQGVELNRKMLSELAIHEPKAFAALVEQVKSKIAA
jgi:large subunit ribosomal protein L20